MPERLEDAYKKESKESDISELSAADGSRETQSGIKDMVKDVLRASSKEDQMVRLAERFSSVERFSRWAEAYYKALQEPFSKSLEAIEEFSFVLVDDDVHNHIAFVPGLIAHSKEATGILFDGSASLEELLQEVEALQPDFVLMDYDLRRGLSGLDVVAEIGPQLPNSRFIGFSTEKSKALNDSFKEVGAVGSVWKKCAGIPDIKDTFDDLSRLIASLRTKE